MCGIIAVLRRRPLRPPPVPALVAAELDALPGLRRDGAARGAAAIADAAARVEAIDAALAGPPGIRCLLRHPDLAARLRRDLADVASWVAAIEVALDAGPPLDALELEQTNAALVRLKDAVWAVTRDRLPAAEKVQELAGPDAGSAAIEAFTSIQLALSALDRLEVRGRDSAGLHVLVSGHGLDLDAGDVRELIEPRRADPLFTSTAVRTPNGLLSFVYKAAAEIGELGDNGRALRAAIAADPLLRRALAADTAEAVVLGHTRWASVGMISEPNAHPLNHEEVERTDGPYVVAALNGDVDNYAELAERHGLALPPEITTDAKVIPVLVSRGIAGGQGFEEAFRRTVSSFVGSVAIAAASADHPDQLALALRGSGQALYVGLCEDAFVVASEPYGLVEQTQRYLRMDGETPADPERRAQTQGQVIVLHRELAGHVEGVTRRAYDGTLLPVDAGEVQRAQITTRDIDRGSFPHFLLKEISEAPHSFRKTLRGKLAERGGLLHVNLSDRTLPEHARRRLRERSIRRVVVIGQGTAAVAGRGTAAMMARVLAESHLSVHALPATELSGFHLRDDMSDTLVVAISQSGTTTDTNRTVDLVRGRGAAVVSIVNRRNSDLTDKSDGVLYTSDGRDVEMSVASTKAFYAQIAAGTLLAFAVAAEAGVGDAAARHETLAALRALPGAMERVLELRGRIAEAAAAHAPRRRYWAVVGNGNNRIAAEEIRIKLSELCYKSIACDTTEDKKHIDLSAEPLILVCAAGLTGSTADDVAKEVEIYRAHKAAPIVIGTDGEKHFAAALAVIPVPAVHPALDFVLAAVAGHLFGYEAARAIDRLADPLRQAHEAIERLVSEPPHPGEDPMVRLARAAEPGAARFFADLEAGAYDGQLEARTATRLSSLLRYALGVVPLEAFAVEHGTVGTPNVVAERLAAALTAAIDELTRPVDAIKHQAKTVTVGISRADEDLLSVPLVAALLAAGAPRDQIGYRDLRALAALDPAVAEVLGYTRYRIQGDPNVNGTIEVVAQGGIARGLRSRAATDPTLRGTKRQVAGEQQVLVAKGASDQRHVILAPELRAGKTVGMTLLHVRFAEALEPAVLRSVLRGYRRRYDTLRNAVMETEPEFRDESLRTVPVADLLTAPIQALADRWRSA